MVPYSFHENILDYSVAKLFEEQVRRPLEGFRNIKIHICPGPVVNWSRISALVCVILVAVFFATRFTADDRQVNGTCRCSKVTDLYPQYSSPQYSSPPCPDVLQKHGLVRGQQCYSDRVPHKCTDTRTYCADQHAHPHTHRFADSSAKQSPSAYSCPDQLPR
jgi:hypothetical protein